MILPRVFRVDKKLGYQLTRVYEESYRIDRDDGYREGKSL